VKLRLAAYSLLDDSEKRDRRLYSPDRTGVLVRREIGDLMPGTWWMLSMAGSF
jgi:hypothetical protein